MTRNEAGENPVYLTAYQWDELVEILGTYSKLVDQDHRERIRMFQDAIREAVRGES